MRREVKLKLLFLPFAGHHRPGCWQWPWRGREPPTGKNSSELGLKIPYPQLRAADTKDNPDLEENRIY